MTTKDLLEFLKKNQLKYISGEQLAAHFGVTRAGIWKHMKKLQDNGVKIEAVTNKGYRLSQSLLCEYEILQNISPAVISSLPFEEKCVTCEVFESIGSTNTYIKNNPKKGLAIVCASEQTAGRGRRGNNFYSPANTGVYFSLAFAGENIQNNTYTICAAVAVCNVLSRLCGEDTKIKWVNDIFFKGKKVCGILTEGTFDFETGTLSEVVVGIGINMQTEIFPDEISQKAASIDVSCNHNILIAQIVEEFFKTLALPQDKIIEIYSQNSLVLGKHVEFHLDGKQRIAIAKSFNQEGNLICQSGEKTYTLKAGEISILGEWGR